MASKDYTQLFNGIDTGLGLIGDMINTGFNIWNAVDQNKQNKWSRDFAQQQFDYQKGLNEKLFEREDNAVQRRAADLQKAGLSKTLAAGGAAQSSVAGISPANAPQSNTNFMDKAIMKTNLLNNKLNIERTNADNKLKGKEGEIIDEKITTEETQQELNKSMSNYYNEMADSQENYRSNLDSQTRVNNAMEQFNISRTQAQQWDNFMNQIQGKSSNEKENSIWTSIKSIVNVARGVRKDNDNIYRQLYERDNKYFNNHGIHNPEDLKKFIEYYNANNTSPYFKDK